VSAGGFTASSVGGWYHTMERPPGTPPDWLFAPVWAVLYVLMGVSAWLVWREQDVAPRRTFAALRLWGWQLLFNAAWTPAFFGLHSPVLGLAVIVALLLMVALTMLLFRRVCGTAALLLAPYLAWVAYATYINVGFVVLN
jgi:translocator protein